MANTTDIIIVSSGELEVVKKICKSAGIKLNDVTANCGCGGSAGPTKLSLTAHGGSSLCLGDRKIKNLITAFHRAKFIVPECAALIIDDDDDVYYSGTYTHHGAL